jgi:hypothetical protein
MKKISFLALIILFVGINSCTKMKLNKLEGTWKYAPLSTEDEGTTITWTFKSDNSFILKTVIDSASITISETGSYSFNKQGGSYYIEIFDIVNDSLSSGSQIEGRHVVKKLNNEVLKVLQVNSAAGGDVYILREFYK